MCGIAGLFRPRQPFHIPEGERLVRQMIGTLVHRGPDADGLWYEPNGRCILGHRRLKIIDTSDAGRQPFTSDDGRWVLTVNGEIYNFQELKPLIERAGGRVRGRTDTEILLQSLALWGVHALEKLDGMFAFAAYDTVTGDLILARDAFGEKPIYLMDLSDSGVAFASELQALECLPGFDPTVDLAAMGELLCFQYIGAPRSIYRNVKKLGPGEWLQLTASGERTSGRFFSFEPAEDVFDRPLPDLADELEDILLRSIRRRMIADVPLGAFLSGGVDSSTVCALLRRKLGTSISTYSIGFKDEPEGEQETARAFARHLETEHHELIIEPHAVDFLKGIGRLLDEPNADGSCLPTFFLSGLARQHVTVAIGGDGGDEMFGGYNRYFDTLEDFERYRQGRKPDWMPGAGHYGARLLVAEEPHIAALFGFIPQDLAEHINRLRAELDQARGSLLAAMRRTDVKNYLPGAILGKVDRMSMRHSLEVRTPYLNIELARFAERLPDWMLVRGTRGKLILREVARRYLPGNFVNLPKRGFGLPISWLRKSLLDVGRSMLDADDGRLASAFGPKAIKKFIASDEPSESVSLSRLWAAAMLESWLRHHPATISDVATERAVQDRNRSVAPQVSRAAGHGDDISVVVLTTGEPTTQAAIDSLHRQTAPLADIIVVRDVVPFHTALNAGVAQVKTPFFVQLDADMVLDVHCIAALRKGMRRDVGIVVGHLRDPLIGRVVGIKLFRTACFQIGRFKDSVSPDTDFVAEIARAGWKTVYIGRLRTADPDQWATYGEHRPDYSLAYTYRKHLIEGCRYRYRQTPAAIRWHFAQLEASQHSSALAAQIGLAQGIFLEQISDLQGTSTIADDFAEYGQFLSGLATDERDSGVDNAGLYMSARECFQTYYRLGVELHQAYDFKTFHRYLGRFQNTRHDKVAWIAKIALCKGLNVRQADGATINADYQTLCGFLLGPDATLGSAVTEPLDVSLEAVLAYAAELGLTRLAIDGAQAGEYRIDRSVGQLNFDATGRTVTSVVLPNGRPRIKAPMQLCGHFVCTDPENVAGIFWCFDLLRSGYVFVHVPTPLGPRKMSLFGQLAKNCLSRVGWLQDIASSFRQTSSLRSAFRQMARRGPSYRSQCGRVLMITSTYSLGGSERQMLVAASGLLQRGYDVRIMALYPLQPGTPNIEDEIAKLGITPHLCSDFLPTQAAGFRAPDGTFAQEISGLPCWFTNKVAPVRAAIRQYRPTVVHAFTDIPAIVGAFAACDLGVSRVVLHQQSMQWCMRRYGAEVVDFLWEGYQGAVDNRPVKLLNNSAAGAADYERWLDLRPGTIGVLYNGIACEQIKKPPPEEVASFRTQLGLPRHAPVVGTVMRFVEDKDPDLWLTTAAEIAKARPEVHFLLAGYGKLQDQMTHRIDVLGLRDRVVLPGAVTDLAPIYAAMDVFLLTSLTEGLPNVVIEAQAAGRPVVAADVGGVSEAISDGRTGRVVRDRLPQPLAKAVLELLDDPAWAARACLEGPAFVAGRFGFERMVAETLEIYRIPKFSNELKDLWRLPEMLRRFIRQIV